MILFYGFGFLYKLKKEQASFIVHPPPETKTRGPGRGKEEEETGSSNTHLASNPHKASNFFLLFPLSHILSHYFPIPTLIQISILQICATDTPFSLPLLFIPVRKKEPFLRVTEKRPLVATEGFLANPSFLSV